MKKIISSLILTFVITGFLQAQNYKPNLQLIVKGTVNAPFYDGVSDVSSNTTFTGFQIEPVVNLSNHWAVFGNFSMDFIPSNNSSIITDQGTLNYSTSNEIAGIAGARYYFTPESGRYMKIYLDAGAGYYSFNIADAVYTPSSQAYTKTFTYPGSEQFGLNLGTGFNINLNPGLFLNLGARLHNLFGQKDVLQTYEVIYSNGTQTETTQVRRDVPNRNYLQITAGLGFRF